MKQDEFNRIQEFCKQEGFEIESYCGGKTVIIGKKDIWEEVEFGYNIDTKKYFKVSEYKWGLSNCVPSKEYSYVEQLKKEAFERFGEIKEGDSFERCWEPKLDQRRKFTIGDRDYTTYGFSYDKELDSLKFDGHSIYKYGKWATKLPGKVEVEYIKSSKINLMSNFTFKIKGVSGYNPNIIGGFLAKQLENYLNDNQK